MPWGACRQGARGKLGLLPRLSLGSAEGLLGALCPNEVFIVRSSFSILNGKQTVKTTSTYAQMMTFKNHLLIPFRVDWADITQPHLLQLTLNGQLRRKRGPRLRGRPCLGTEACLLSPPYSCDQCGCLLPELSLAGAARVSVHEHFSV